MGGASRREQLLADASVLQPDADAGPQALSRGDIAQQHCEPTSGHGAVQPADGPEEAGCRNARVGSFR